MKCPVGLAALLTTDLKSLDQACHFSKNSWNSEGADFDFQDYFNFFRGSISFQTKEIASKSVD